MKTPAVLAALAALAASCGTRAASAQQPPPPPDADVEVPAQPAPPSQAAPAPQILPAPATSAPPSSAELAALREELAETRAQLKTLSEQVKSRPREAPAVAPSSPSPGSVAAGLAPSDYAISAYIQGQLETHQDSEDEVQQGGALLNQDRFLVRRGRVRLDAAWKYAELAFEVDGSTTRGLAFGARRAEASLVWRGDVPFEGKVARRGPRGGAPPYVAVTLGLTEIPFGFELVDSSRDRVFMERSQGSVAFFPGEPDVGLRIAGGLGFFRYALALMNGEPLDDRATKPGREPNSGKDFIARFGVDTEPVKWLRVAGGASALGGRGFHAGTEATKNAAQWRDLNENAAIDAGEVTAAPGSAATPSESYSRWAVGVDLAARLHTALGWSTLYGEATIATNLDRGLFVADPVLTGVDTRELSYYGALVQEITPYGLVGFRADVYNPNADFFDKRGGKLLPSSQTIRTLSPVVGLVLPDRARLLFQYDLVSDSLTKDERGVPTDLENNRFTIRLQVQL